MLAQSRCIAMEASMVLMSLGITESLGHATGGEVMQKVELMCLDGSRPVLPCRGGTGKAVMRKFPLGQVSWLLGSQRSKLWLFVRFPSTGPSSSTAQPIYLSSM